MNLLSSFNNFYSNLSSNGVFFFWIAIFLFIFVVFLTAILVNKNKKLSKLVDENINEDIPIINDENDIIDKKDKKDNVIDNGVEKENILVENNFGEESLKFADTSELKEETYFVKEDNVLNEMPDLKSEDLKNNSNEKPGLYEKNVLREMNTYRQTSPIHIDKKEEIKPIKEEVKEDNGFDLTGIDYGEDFVSPLEELEDNYEVNDGMKFASEIVDRMEEEVKPSNIELTDYEKKQEEEAIISYDELVKVKDRIYNITEDEETDEFIDELRSFRSDLK